MAALDHGHCARRNFFAGLLYARSTVLANEIEALLVAQMGWGLHLWPGIRPTGMAHHASSTGAAGTHDITGTIRCTWRARYALRPNDARATFWMANELCQGFPNGAVWRATDS